MGLNQRGGVPGPPSRSVAGLARRASSVAALTLAANFSPSASAEASDAPPRGGCGPAGKAAPLSPIALWNRPLASGEAIRMLTENDPADSPKMVTLPGSPPNAAAFFCTHCSAAI
jgi:hypothetical protein